MRMGMGGRHHRFVRTDGNKINRKNKYMVDKIQWFGWGCKINRKFKTGVVIIVLLIIL